MQQAYLQEIIKDQYNLLKQRDAGLKRDIDVKKHIKTSIITIISGVRRSGKSTLLKQISLHFPQFYYINFDDERLINFTVDDFNILLILWEKDYPSKYILIDEIQNVVNWERFVRRIHDQGYKLFITGSNAKLLSSELATHLTGRYEKIELYPFSFKEYLHYHDVGLQENYISSEKAKILRLFDRYVSGGGFPEYVKYDERDYLQRIYEDIVYRDILTRFKIKETKTFRQLTNYLYTNIAKRISYTTLKNILGIKTAMSVRSYISFLEESYLLFELYKYDFSLKKQYVSDKKIYCIDTGMRNAVAFHFSQDRGRLLENVVFIELKRRGLTVYFYKNKHECDFLIEEKNKIIGAIQITQVLNAENEERELKGLIGAMDQFRLKKGIILTEYQSEKRRIKNKTILLLPMWQWLLGRTMI